MVKKIGWGCGTLLFLVVILVAITTNENKIRSNASPAATTRSLLTTADYIVNDELFTEYTNELHLQTEELGGSLTHFRELTSNPQINDENWRLKVATTLAIWQVIYSEAQAMTPPPSLQGFHAKYVEALGRFDSAADDLANGIQNHDQELIDRASDKIHEANMLMADAQTQIPS